MGQLTLQQIITQGGVIGGNDAVSAWVETKVRAWLLKHYAAWPWPFVMVQAIQIPLNAGATSVIIGMGNNGFAPTSYVHRVFNPIYFRANGYSTRGKAPITEIVGGPPESFNDMFDPATTTGQPMRFTAMPGVGPGLWSLKPYPVPDKNYLLAFTYHKVPVAEDITLSVAYPNDMTLIQVAKCAALEYDEVGSLILQNEEQILAAMVAADRDTYGGGPSFGDTLQLDDTTFPSTANYDISKMMW